MFVLGNVREIHFFATTGDDMKKTALTTHPDRLLRRTIGLLLAVATALTLQISATQAQDLDMRYQPISPLGNVGTLKLPEEKIEATGSPDILIPSLQGIIFVDNQSMVQSPAPATIGIQIDGTNLGFIRTGSFNRVVDKYVNQPVSIASLNALARDVIMYYKNNGRPVVDVSIPEQDITNGVVYVVVTEARLGRVSYEGNRYFDSRVLGRYNTLHHGQHLSERQLLEELRWYNENPFRRVNVEMRPGRNYGETDVVYKVQDRLPWQFYAGYDDTGTRQTSLERLSFGAIWGNAFNRDHTLSYQLTASPNFKDTLAHSAVYVIPRANRDKFVMYGSYASNNPYIDPFWQDGYYYETGFLYDKKLKTHYLSDDKWYEHRANAGFQFKEVTSVLDFGIPDVPPWFETDPAQVAQIALGYNARLFDKYGVWSLGANLYISPGGFSKGNSDDVMQQYRWGADSQYTYARVRLERYRDICDRKFKLYLKGEGQAATGNLFTTEQYGMGGTNSVRGYDSYQLNFDNALVFTAELQTAPKTLGLSRYFRTREQDMFQAVAFYDHGMGWNNHTYPGDPYDYKYEYMNSVGVGLRYSLTPYFQVKFDYGWQLHRDVPNNHGSGRPHLSFVLSR